MKFTAQDIAAIIGGTVDGDENAIIKNVSKIDDSKPETLAFLSNPSYTHHIYNTQASVVIVKNDFTPEKDLNCTLIRVEDPYQAIATLLNAYAEMQPQKVGVEEPSFISKSATIGEDIYIGAFAYIGENVCIGDNVKIYPNAYIGDNTTIGDNVIIYAGAKLYPHTQIGNECIIHAGAVLGSDGFGFAPTEDGSYKKIAQIGNVKLEDCVEIGANAAIDCATMGSTLIKKGVKIDNLVQIAHNVVIGENTVMASQTGIAGSTKVGKNCIFAGQVGIAGHLKIGDKTTLAAQAGIMSDVKEGQTLFGTPALDAKQAFRIEAVKRKLPELRKEINALSKKIKSLDL
ncbi:UDP-3-O-(3-hydroxymyristoyl)glucosamine N-acyltransferase [Halosquirtibacter xylanolyticus]|uniref:UDP-3-O-(3-hydroxymyristoyl)glucosamine N-acyltransferase n=1 Tax=Halosquirtibacter xylanolyticus TaxID=3374599 RepID=UPI003747E9D8|nr:UDP-3-O-(3-hydroxymyristoyl)glucosamine N-acyltransferase [Prolixibacteraceae bacterium]